MTGASALTAALTAAQMSAQLDAVLAREPSAQVVAMRADSRQDWPEAIARRGRRFAVHWCESRLALREALSGLDDQVDAAQGLLVLTPLRDHEVPDDVAARLARARVFQLCDWDVVRQMFDAQVTDARLGPFEWMAQCLMDLADQGPYLPVLSGFLDLESAWRAVLQRALAIDAARPDAGSLLKWTQRPDADLRLGHLPPQARSDVLAWLASGSGAAGALTVQCIASGRTADALPLAVACDVIFSAAGEGVAALGQSAIRLERFVGDRHVGLADGRAWAAQARQLLAHEPAETLRAALDRADALLRELRVAEHAHLSELLPSGLEQRLVQFAHLLQRHALSPTDALAAEIEDASNAVLRHQLAATQGLRVDRVKMARRLARWLVRPLPGGAAAAGSFDDRAAWQADEGAFVDWARFKLLGGDELPELSEAYGQLRAAITQRRDPLAQAFARSLVERNREGWPAGGRGVPVERVLDQLLAPLAAAHPVLLLVVDGLSVAIFRELFERPERWGWTEWVRQGSVHAELGLAALPTITEVSRTSLLSGRLATGNSGTEKSAFASHPALLARSTSSHGPRLFHKGDLADDGNLAADVRAALANPQQRVVGVVYNAVDDHLSGPDQLQQRWSLEDLRLLLPLLREARDARRVVVVTADHGHLLEDGSRLLAGGDSDRWRPGSRVTDAAELALSGGRTVTADGSNAVVCLWSETVRYTGRKNGYHGGISPQEVAVPLSVLAPFGVNVAGWQPAPPQQPEWWDLPATLTLTVAAEPAPRPAARKKTARDAAAGGLFPAGDLPVPASTSMSTPAASTETDWIAALLRSQIFVAQRQLAARVALPDDQMHRLLEGLSERGGKLSRPALAQRMAVPELRLNGMLSAARRVLNVDQAAVLTVDDAAGMVELNRALLLQQFGISAAGAAR